MTMNTLRTAVLAALVTGAVLCTTLTGASPAHAVDQPGAPGAVQDSVRELARTADAWVPTPEQQTAELFHIWLREHGDTSSGLPIEPSRVSGFSTPGGLVLRVPFAASAGVLPESGVSGAFTADGRLIGTSELVLTPRSAESGQVRLWTDGVLRVDRLVQESEAPSVTASSWWSRFSDCLNSKGVAAWAVTALTIACSAICIASVGTLCIACLAAASAVTSGTISYCVAKANHG